jgi:hypothetical protein
MGPFKKVPGGKYTRTEGATPSVVSKSVGGGRKNYVKDNMYNVIFDMKPKKVAPLVDQESIDHRKISKHRAYGKIPN